MRIMTSNIWGDYFGNPVEVREDGIFETFRKYAPDVIGLQEITQGWYNAKLFKRLSENYRILGTELFYNNNYVPMAISKAWDILAKGYEYLTETPDQSKAITWAVIEKDGKRLGVFNTHFWWKYDCPKDDEIRVQNAKQLVGLMRFVKERFDCPVFGFGDLNSKRDHPVFKVFQGEKAEVLFDLTENKDDVSTMHGDPVADEKGFYHGKTTQNPYSMSLDYIIGMGTFKTEQYRVVCDKAILDATDHSPVFAEICL